MCGSMVDSQSAAAEIRRGKTRRRRRKIETTGQNYNGLPYYRAAIIMHNYSFPRFLLDFQFLNEFLSFHLRSKVKLSLSMVTFMAVVALSARWFSIVVGSYRVTPQETFNQ